MTLVTAMDRRPTCLRLCTGCLMVWRMTCLAVLMMSRVGAPITGLGPRILSLALLPSSSFLFWAIG